MDESVETPHSSRDLILRDCFGHLAHERESRLKEAFASIDAAVRRRRLA